ncbi:hypothetical protein [Hoyosella altamirensis]|uniref:hypothetical protein n=1 Tax=Hoyosella altamirensis TaxID=616997 RepID=UPI0007DB4A09|nr:hypothetical protein [Hoyosella altamirensis]
MTAGQQGEWTPTPEGLDLTCFIICPIGHEGDDVRRRSDQVKRHIVDPAVMPLGYRTDRADLVDESGLIGTHIVNSLITADLVVADLTHSNPNVFYELALRHAFAKPFIQIIDKSERLPFDVAGQRTIFFDYKDLDSAADARERINRAARQIRDGGDDYKAESPVSQTVDLQQLRSSGNPEQVTMAAVSESLSEIRTELRLYRHGQPRPYSREQTEAIRHVLIGMAADGRLRAHELEILDSAIGSNKNYDAFLQELRKRMPSSSSNVWGTFGSSSTADDEPPF